jgi:GntR family transcriptional repressor for pyruvate dehydrogenase complex
MAKVMSSQNASLQDLLEVRMGLECNAAALAAQRAGDDDIEFLEKSLAEIEKQVNEGRLGSSADTQFHMAIAYATHNPLQVYLMKQFYDFLAYGIKENLFTLYRESRQFETIQKQHIQIVSGIKARDPMRAHLATKQHIEYVIQTIREGEQAAATK